MMKGLSEIKNQKGFTLIELMMVTVTATIVIGAMFIALRTGTEQIETMDVKMAIQDNAREGLYKMIQEIRLSASDRITISGGGNTITFDVPDPDAPVNTNTSDAVQDYSIDWTGAATIQYSVNGNSQIIRTDTDTEDTSVIANNVTEVEFTGDAENPSVVTVVMSVQRTMLNGQLIPATPLQITGQAEIRNT